MKYSPVDEILEKKKNYINSLDIIQQFHFLGINEKYFGLTEVSSYFNSIFHLFQ